MVFNVKRVVTPGILADDAFMQQLKQFGDQRKAEMQTAPMPNSAVDFARNLQTSWFDKLNKPIRTGYTPDGPVGGEAASPMPEMPAMPQQRQTAADRAAMDEARGSDMADAWDRFGPYVAPGSYFGGKLIGALGTMSPERSAEATTQSLEELRAQEQEQITRLNDMTEAARLGERLKMSGGDTFTPPQDELTDVARDLGFTNDTQQQQKDAISERDRGIASQQLQDTRSQIAERTKQPLKQEWWLNAMQVGAKSAAETGLSGLKYPLMFYEMQREAITGNPDRSDARAWLDATSAAIDKLLPGDKARSKDFMTKLSAGGGSYAAFLLTGYVGAVARLPAATAYLGAASQGVSMAQDAERMNATSYQKYMALIIGSGLGMTEAIPIDRMFARADAYYGGTLQRLLSTTSAASMQEFLQEAGQAVGEDISAKFLIGYDPDREISVKDWLEAGAVGAITGAGGALATNAMRGGNGAAEGAADPAVQQEQAVRQAIETKQLEVDNALGGERVPDIGADVGPLPPPGSSPVTDAAQAAPTADVEGETGVQVFRGGTMPAPREDGMIELNHWSNVPLQEIDPTMRGTGPLRGAERARLVGPDAVDRSYFGVGDPEAYDRAQAEEQARRSKMTPKEKAAATREDNKRYDRYRRGEEPFPGDTAPYRPEGGLGPYRHTIAVKPEELYNWREDPMNLKAGLSRSLTPNEQSTQYEKLIRDAGFKGIYFASSPLGQTAVMFDKRQPERVVDDRARKAYNATKLTDTDTTALPGLTGSPGPVPSVVQAARAYAKSINLPARRQSEYVQVDKDRAKRIAQAYEEMQHDPEAPAVKAAYRAMIDETLAQYQYVKATGLKIDFIEQGMDDPYPQGPKQVLADLKNNHLWVFPTDSGFGTLTEAEKTNPLLEPTDEYVNGRRLLANDVFRIVHDFFGHGIEGSGFGARGEENAWQSHMRLYTDKALPAVTSETRGQNSWVNFGPHGEANRANQRETIYADQKTGIMPEWTWREGVADDEQFDAMFAGSSAQTLDSPSFIRAMDMTDEGVDPETIWNETGFYRGVDGRWRFEIVDAEASLSPVVSKTFDEGKDYRGTLASVLHHKKLCEAYPELRGITVGLERTDTTSPDHKDPGGQFNPDTGELEAWADTDEELISIILHEVQHAVQEIENTARGGNLSMGRIYDGTNVETWRRELANAEDRFNRGEINQATLEFWRTGFDKAAAYEYYRRIGGEVEARNVQRRYEESKMLLERAKRGERVDPFMRELYPELTEDVDRGDQIVITRSRDGMGARMAQAARGPRLADTDTPAFKAWFGDSKVIDAAGNPMVVYHGTAARTDFSSFYPLSHFGTSEAANSRVESGFAGGTGGGARVLPVFLSIKNPLAVKDNGLFGVDGVADAALAAKGITKKQYDAFSDAFSADGEDGGIPVLIDALEANGFDGLTYVNTEEDAGSVSWVALQPEQVKSVNNQGSFDPDDPDILAMTGTPKGTAQNRNAYKGEQTRPEAGIPVTPGATPAEVSLTQIANNVVKALDLTARQGRLSLRGSEVMGQYSRKQAVVRLRTWGDLSTLVHEGGHALHDASAGALKAFETKFAADLRKVAEDLYADTTPLNQDQLVREGFAEFFRVYTLSRQFAYKHYPDMVDEFSRVMETNAPQTKKALDAVGDQFAAWLQLPSERLIAGMVVDATQPGKVNQAVQELREAGFPTWFHEHARNATATVVNRLAPLNDVVVQMLNVGQTNSGQAVDLKRADDPRVLAQLSRNTGSRAMVQLTDGVMPYRSTQPASRGLREAILLSQGLRADQAPRRFDEKRLKDFDGYLIALRARDEYERYAKGIIKRPPINASIGDIGQAITDFEGRYGQSFRDAAEIVHEFGMALWKKQYDAGLMDVDTYRDGLTRNFYAPLQRDMSDKKASLGQSAITGGQSVVRQFRGSDRQIVSPTAVLMHKAFALEQIIAENDVKKALAVLADRVGTAGSLVERVPASTLMSKTYSVREVAKQLTNDEDISATDAADLMSILQTSMDNDNVLSFFRPEQARAKGENIVFYWENGKLAAVQVKDGDVGADIVNLLNGVGRENFNQIGIELIAGVSTAVRSAITLWPDFLLVNYVRDQFSAWVLNDVGFKPFWSGARGMFDEVRQNEWARSYNASLGLMGGMNVASLHDARVRRDIKALRGKGYITKAFGESGYLGAAKGMANLVELSETGTRLGLFKGAYERAKADGLSDWEASIEAAYTATDYIDYGLNGNHMLLARRTIPFLNAQLQGLSKMMRTLGANEVRQRKGLRFALSAFFKSTNGMDLSRTEKQAIITGRKAWVKMASLGLLSAALAFAFEDDPDYQETSEYLRTTHWVIPLGDGEIITIPKPFELAILANAVERGFEMAAGDPEAKKRFLRGLAFNLAPPTTPPAIGTLTEMAANYDFFSGREIVPDYMRALEPELQYNNYTTEFAKWLGANTNMSPMMIDHFMSSLGASAYRDLSTMINQTNPNRPSLDATDAPIIRRFVRDARRGAVSAQDFWKQASTQTGTLRGAEVSYKTMLEGGNESGANRFLDTLEPDTKAYALLGAHFKAEHKRLNPIYRARQVATVISAMRREIGSDLGLGDTTRKGSTDTIRLTSGTKAKVDEALSEYVRREVRNTLIATQTSGWAGKRKIAVDKTMDMLDKINPEVADELRRRLKKAKVYDAQTVYDAWPEARNRLLMDREAASLDDLVSAAKVSNP